MREVELIDGRRDLRLGLLAQALHVARQRVEGRGHRLRLRHDAVARVA